MGALNSVFLLWLCSIVVLCATTITVVRAEVVDSNIEIDEDEEEVPELELLVPVSRDLEQTTDFGDSWTPEQRPNSPMILDEDGNEIPFPSSTFIVEEDDGDNN